MSSVPTTIKTTSDVDYILYFDKDKKLIGYEMSEDDKNAFQLRYKTPDGCGIVSTIPEGTNYFLEVFGIASTLAFLIKDEVGELLYYRPSPIELSREINKTFDTLETLEGSKEEEKKNLPVIIPDVSDERMKDILDRVPYPNWMNECWGTRAWIQVWKEKPSLQTIMLEFSAAKYEEKKGKELEKSPGLCIYHIKGHCQIHNNRACEVIGCSDYDTL